jgi:hypothetical protein
LWDFVEVKMSIAQNLPNKIWRIFAIIINLIIVASFFSPMFATTAFAIDTPQPLYPQNFAITDPITDPPAGVPSFSWSSVTGANIYRLQVDDDVEFAQPITMDITTPNTSFSPQSVGHLFTDGDWYWRLRVEDPEESAWSAILRFTKTWATPDNRPFLSAPPPDELLPFFDFPTFSWSPVIGAAGYRFQIATTQWGFDTPILSMDTLSTSYQPTNRLTNGLYYWRVVPMDTADHLGTPSEARAFHAAYGINLHDFPEMVPILISPDDESFPTFTPTFHWSAVEGAEHYRLEYTLDDQCDFSLGEGIDTRQTFYTPTDTFPNDFRYCWRVRAESGSAIGNWSQTWHFQKRWDLKPILLTPTQLYQTGLYPLYSWTPVPGASRYQIQISIDHFDHIYEEATVVNTFYTPQNYAGNEHYWWRVRTIDGGGKFGVFSDEADFQCTANSIAPILVYPHFYYLPDNYGGAHISPYEDRTVPFPIFIWHRVMVPAPTGGIFATAYRIQVSTTPNFFSLDWEYDTENTSATPTQEEGFIPIPGQDYYWRVCPLDQLGGDCLYPSPGWQWWSQVWKARFDDQLKHSPTVGLNPDLLRPAYGQELVEASPLFEWWPFMDIDQNPATQYQIQVSREEDFSTSEINETVTIPAYSPVTSLAQRSLGRANYGTFYWRVRGLTTQGWSQWSDVWRFQIASQSEWRYSRTIGQPSNQLLIGTDPIIDEVPIPKGYNLSTLYAAQSSTDWFFGFNVDISSTNMTYVFYIDLDNLDGSGAVLPPERDYQVSTNLAHQPEYAIYVDEVAGVINTQNTWIYAWNGSSWEFGDRFSDIGGGVYTTDGYVEIRVPSTVIGMDQDTSSASVILFSVNQTDGILQDTVPSDPDIPGNATLNYFSAVSDHLNLVYPPNTATGDTFTTPSILPFFWDWPSGSNGSTPFAGSILEVDVDEDYSPPHEATYQFTSNTSYFSNNQAAPTSDIIGDRIYYWRIRSRYMYPGFPEGFGAWTKGWSFRRLGFKPQNLTTSITFATPSFHWDMAEGADTYDLQVAIDPYFDNRVVDVTTTMNTYTPLDTLAQGSYYWRVRINRFGSTGNDWSNVEEFSISLPTPSDLTPDQQIIDYSPNYCWSPVILDDDNGDPVFTAWRYYLQVSKDPDFNTTYAETGTFHNCWTPTSGYDDGTYYWRVAIIDGNGRMGFYSTPATFTKQYPVTTLISPIEEVVTGTPSFKWTPVDGAATYLFEVSWYSTFNPVYDTTETFNVEYTPTRLYTSDEEYYWRVAIRDRNGKIGPFTDATFFIRGNYPAYLPLMLK